MKITFFGAAREVTGSCTLLETPTTRVIVDCGMHQGSGNSYDRNMAPFPFDPKSIDAVILTHAHIDHTGRTVQLVKNGFKGRIFATHPTRLLSKLMWQDAARVMKDEQRRYGRPAPYMPKDIPATYEMIHGASYDTTVRVSDDFSFKFREAGHIFGSGFIEANAYGTKVVMSGDLGNDYVPILRPTSRIVEGDIVVMESTYGDRVHEDPQHRSERLKAAVIENHAKKGTLLIPAFSLERAQEILYELNTMVENKQVPRSNIFLDSPLAIKALPIYHQFAELYDQEAAALKASGDDFFKFPGLTITKKPAESRAILEAPTPKIIIAGSGMMHGGRIMHHLVDYLSRPNTTLLVVGYQSAGTVGRAISEGAKMVRIDHEQVEVRAKVEIIGSYSAHADQLKLMKWVTSAVDTPRKVYLNHGEPHASEELAQKLRIEHGLEVAVPAIGDTFTHP